MKRIDVEHQLANGKRGGDLWNDTTVAFRARRQGAVTVEYTYRGTGLWLDCTLIMADGTRKDVRLFD